MSGQDAGLSTWMATAVGLLMLGGCAPSAQPPASEEVSLTPLFIDAGTARAGSIVEHRYSVENSTDASVRLTSIRRSCGCLSFAIDGHPVVDGVEPDVVVPPRTRVPVVVTIDTLVGDRTFHFQLTGVEERDGVAGDPVDLRAELRIKGERDAWLARKGVDLGVLQWSDLADVEWTWRVPPGRPLDIVRVEHSAGLSNVEMETDGDGGRVRAQFRPRTWGRPEETVVLHLSSGTVLEAVTRAEVLAPFDAGPGRVGLGVLDPGAEGSSELLLPLRADVDPPVAAVVSGRVAEAVGLQAVWESDRLRWTWSADGSPGPLSGWISLTWGDGRPDYRLPVSGYLRPARAGTP